ncbi:hypothetical protein OIN59_19970 [Acidovorax sp. D2M1]|uniref:Uncharacterized protein n=1 Tax=Acidovorax benzenivorans TaxID=2987520 RepID=A0ABT5S3K2_9BURK|nr:hypothetical protein [Acidovorax benzenivorans]MDD2179723.1 hypothetical protein [Acidovorax benzenivorans]
MSTTGFFAVGRNSFTAACKLGMNPACAFLVMACGTGKDNVSTRWSAEAVGSHVGMRWSAAKEAIEALCSHGIATKGGKPARPSYKLQKDGDLIWLPRTLVEGAANEVAPVAKMRQTQDPMALRLLVELYTAQNLREDGGINAKTVYQAFDRRKAGQQGAYTVWDFTSSGSQWVFMNSDAAKAHRREALTAEEKMAGKKPEDVRAVDFFRRLKTLEALGLIEWVPYLYDGPNGEPMHALACNGLQAEKALYEAATDAAARMIGESWAQSIEGIAVPVQTHIAEATMIGIARLRYRPHTTLTSAWWAEHHSVCSAFTEQYNALAAPKAQAGAPSSKGTGTFDFDLF